MEYSIVINNDKGGAFSMVLGGNSIDHLRTGLYMYMMGKTNTGKVDPEQAAITVTDEEIRWQYGTHGGTMETIPLENSMKFTVEK